MFDLIGAGLSAIGGLFSGDKEQEAAQRQADALRANAQATAEASKFKPIGIANRAASTSYGYDPSGNLSSAGYTLTPEFKALQDQFMGSAPGMLGQFQNSMQTTAPMGQAANSMFNLGNQYLGTSPEAQAQKWMQNQQALLAAPRADQLANLRANQMATGRAGLAVGGNAGMQATNPEMAAYYNSLAQQDMGLAANAYQAGQQDASFGAGMVGSGGKMLQDMYGTQVASRSPYDAALGGAMTIENLGQNALTQGMNYGATTTNARANAANALQSGLNNADGYQYRADSYSPWGTALMNAGNALGGMSFGDSISGMFSGGGQQVAEPNAPYNSMMTNYSVPPITSWNQLMSPQQSGATNMNGFRINAFTGKVEKL